MGASRRGIDSQAVQDAADRGVYEWKTRTSIFREVGDAKLAEYVAAAVITPEPGRSARAPHAFSDAEVIRFLNLLRPAPQPSLNSAHRLLDEFAAYVGISVRAESSIPLRARRANVLQVEKAAEKLAEALKAEPLETELMAPGHVLRAHTVRSALRCAEELANQCKAHRGMLDRRGGKGKEPGDDLRHHHVHMAAVLCEFIAPDFRPSRSVSDGDYGALLAISELLATPIFEPGTKWERAVRTHVDNWNRNWKAALDSLAQK